MYTFTSLRGILEIFFIGLLISVSGANINQTRTPASPATFNTYCCPVLGQPFEVGSPQDGVKENIEWIQNQDTKFEVEAKSCRDLVCSNDATVQLCNEVSHTTYRRKHSYIPTLNLLIFGSAI
jgi:hypothetical protein